MSNLLRESFGTVIQSYLNELAKTCPHQKKAECSGLTVELDFEQMKCYHHDVTQSNDIVISYDYWTDELQGLGRDEVYAGSECEQVCNWFDEVLWRGTICNFMAKFHYYAVDDTDGSGGGLYYGSWLYRKRQTHFN